MSDKIGALWLKDGKKGKYFSGVIEVSGQKIGVVVFKNNHKTEDRYPDYDILVCKPRKQGPGTDKFDDQIPF